MNKNFLSWLSSWYQQLPSESFDSLHLIPEKTAVISVDMIKGFCSAGPLASPNVSSIIPSIVNLFKQGYVFGIRDFVLVQDAHTSQAVEFSAYPPHCLKGSEEAQTIDELKQLSDIHPEVIEKNSLSPAYDTSFNQWLTQHSQMDTFIVVGNCTDLCIYSMAMHLRLSANSTDMKRRIIVPANGVATYDLPAQAGLPVETAKKIGALPHDASLLHPLFLYHLRLNGIEVIRECSVQTNEG